MATTVKRILETAIAGAAKAFPRRANGIRVDTDTPGKATLTAFLDGADQVWIEYDADQLDVLIGALHKASDRLRS